MNFSVVRRADTKWGRTFALKLAQQKRHLILLGENRVLLEKLSQDIVFKNNVRVHYREVEDTDTASIISTADWINANFEVDMLVNYAETDSDPKFSDYNVYQLDRTLKTSYATGTLYIHQLLPNLLLHGQACIVNIWCSKLPVKPWEQALIDFNMRFSEYLNDEMASSDLRIRSYVLPVCEAEDGILFSDHPCLENASVMIAL